MKAAEVLKLVAGKPAQTSPRVVGFEPHGRGKMTYGSGDVYEGDWEGGVRSGFGTVQWANGDGYTGDWERGEPTGEGARLFANGDAYRGELIDRKRHGMGRCTYADGATFDGYWVNDLWHSAPDGMGARVPALGAAWASCVNTRLVLTREATAGEAEGVQHPPSAWRRELHVAWSPRLGERSVPFELAEHGLAGVTLALR